MAILTIRTYPDPILRTVCRSVKGIDEKTLGLLGNMAETMYAANGIGLAAPQVGESLRLVVIDIGGGEGDHLLKLINPKVAEREGNTRSEEGCLSLPDLRVEVDRCQKVRVIAHRPDGEETAVEAEGLLSIALQHEIDHLDGKLIVDRLSSLRRNLYRRKRTKGE